MSRSIKSNPFDKTTIEAFGQRQAQLTEPLPSPDASNDGDLVYWNNQNSRYDLRSEQVIPVIDLKPACFRHPSPGANITTTEAKMSLTVEEVSNANYTLVSDTIEILEAGVYQISWSMEIMVDSTSGAIRGSTYAYVKNISTIIDQSRSTSYVREGTTASGVGNTFIANLNNANNVLSIYALCDTGTDVSQGNTQLSIIKLT